MHSLRSSQKENRMGAVAKRHGTIPTIPHIITPSWCCTWGFGHCKKSFRTTLFTLWTDETAPSASNRLKQCTSRSKAPLWRLKRSFQLLLHNFIRCTIVSPNWCGLFEIGILREISEHLARISAIKFMWSATLRSIINLSTRRRLLPVLDGFPRGTQFIQYTNVKFHICAPCEIPK